MTSEWAQERHSDRLSGQRSSLNPARLRAARHRFFVGVAPALLGGEREPVGTPRADARWLAAYHEAGHALIGTLLARADRPEKASTSPIARAYAVAAVDEKTGANLLGERYRRGRITGLVAGVAAEHLVFGRIDEGAGDIEAAEALARDMLAAVAQTAASKTVRLLPTLVDDEFPVRPPAPAAAADDPVADDPVVREIALVVSECYEQAIEVLGSERDTLDGLAAQLHAGETLDEDAIRGSLAPTSVGVVGTDAAGRAPQLRHRPVRIGGWLVRGLRPVPLALAGAGAGAPAETSTRIVRLNRSSPAVPALPLERPPVPGGVVVPFGGTAATDRSDASHQSIRVMRGQLLVRYLALAVLWGVATASFWVWWLEQRAGSTGPLYWLQTTMLFYQTTLLPTVYWGFVGKMRRPVEMRPPAGLKVALVTLCVPTHEAVDVIREQLDALSAVTYPHDSWILDEGGSAQVRELARQRGVRYFSRAGVGLWNQPKAPFQRSTKAGNVNAWLDHVASLGLEYDVFVQFDIDHRPRADYLDRTLGYFRDPKVGWVQAPSVYRNLDNWAARGLVEQDLVFHGPLQMSFYGVSRTPFIIGSHTSYRTSAIRGIGGFQPTRAEDHLDTVVLAANHYEGVFVPETIAVGDGPDGLATYLRQQFAWAYSMIQIFLHHTPGLVRRYSPRQAFQFLFCQSWYTLWSVSLAVLWLLPTIALLIREPIADVRLSRFFLYFLPVVLTSSLMWCETRRWFQPSGVKLSWRGVVLGIVRWPVVLWALVNVLLRVKRPYMITPKGVSGERTNGALLYGPGLAIGIVPLAAVWLCRATGGAGAVQGYYVLALANATLGLLSVALTLGLELRSTASEAGVAYALRSRLVVIAWTAAMASVLAFSSLAAWGQIAGAIA